MTSINQHTNQDQVEQHGIDQLQWAHQQQFLKNLVDSSFHLIWQTDQTGKLTNLNSRWEKTLGLPLNKIIGHFLSDFQPKEFSDRDNLLFQSLLNGNKIDAYETALIDQTGELIYLLIDAFPLTDENNQKTIGTQGIAIDITDRKISEKTVRRSEALLLRSQQISSVGYYILDIINGNWTNSPVLDEIFGINALFSRTIDSWLSIIHPEYKDEMANHLSKQSFNQHDSFNKEYRIVRPKDDNIRWVHCKGDLEFDNSGNPVKMFGTIQDITERKLVETALKASEDRMKSIFRAAPVGIGLTIDRKIIEINDRFIEMTGYSREEVMGKNTVFLYPSIEEYEKVGSDKYQQIARKGIGSVETQWVKKDGSIIDIILSSSPLDETHIEKGVSFTALDITDKKRTADALAAEKERLAVTLKSIGDGVIATDTEGRIVLINHVAEELTGWKQEECTGLPLKTVFNIIHEITKKPCQSPVEKVLKSNQIEELANHTILISRSGQERIIADSGAPIRDRNGNIIGVVLVFRDTTEKEKLLTAVQNNQRLESLGVLAGGIAHDFNNIMGGVFGYIELAHDEIDSPVAQQYLKEALKAISRVKGLTQQLLTFSKGGEPIRKIAPLFPFISEMSQFALSGSNVSCITETPENLWSCSYDANQIGQVIDNIVINAQQAMPMGGSILISAQNITIKNNHPLLTEGSYVKISFKDHGIGIPKEILCKIFDPFFTTKQKGSGLGLATSYSIINRHGGTIEVESVPGKGTIFHIFLPATESLSIQATTNNNIEHHGEGQILVVDDEEIIQQTMRIMLESMKYKVICVCEGKAALDIYFQELKNNRYFTAIIADLTIPAGMGGKELAEEIRKSDTAIPIIVSSGYADDPIMANPEKYGFTDSLSKPFRKADLVKLLNKHIVEQNRSANEEHS